MLGKSVHGLPPCACCAAGAPDHIVDLSLSANCDAECGESDEEAYEGSALTERHATPCLRATSPYLRRDGS